MSDNGENKVLIRLGDLRDYWKAVSDWVLGNDEESKPKVDIATKGKGYTGSSDLINSGTGGYELPLHGHHLYKMEFIAYDRQEVTVIINGGDPIVLWNGYFATDSNDAKIISFEVVTEDTDFYWYGAY